MTEPAPRDLNIALICECGHSSGWHSHGGGGDCEHNGECSCRGFTPAEDRGPCGPLCGDTVCVECDVPSLGPERIAEWVEGAEKVLADGLPAGHKLWKSWALDLAGQVLALAKLYKQTVTKSADLPITEERPRDVRAPGAAT